MNNSNSFENNSLKTTQSYSINSANSLKSSTLSNFKRLRNSTDTRNIMKTEEDFFEKKIINSSDNDVLNHKNKQKMLKERFLVDKYRHNQSDQ